MKTLPTAERATEGIATLARLPIYKGNGARRRLLIEIARPGVGLQPLELLRRERRRIRDGTVLLDMRRSTHPGDDRRDHRVAQAESEGQFG